MRTAKSVQKGRLKEMGVTQGGISEVTVFKKTPSGLWMDRMGYMSELTIY